MTIRKRRQLNQWVARALGTLVLTAMVLVPVAWAATTYTTQTCMPKPTPGDVASQNTWGALLNTGSDIIDAITSRASSISVAGASNVVLTFSCGTLDQSDAAHFTFTGALTGNIYVLWPNSRARTFSVTNSTTGSFTLSLAANNGASAPAGLYVAVPQGDTGVYYSNGTDVKTRVTPGGIPIAASSVLGNTSASASLGASLAIPDCTGGLTWAAGSGFGCNSGGGGGGGGGGTALAWGSVQTTSFTAAANTIYCIDTITTGAVTMTLPATPVAGNQIAFVDCAGGFATNALTVANNTNLLMGLSENMTVNSVNAGATLQYSGVTLGWRMF